MRLPSPVVVICCDWHDAVCIHLRQLQLRVGRGEIPNCLPYLDAGRGVGSMVSGVTIRQSDGGLCPVYSVLTAMTL